MDSLRPNASSALAGVFPYHPPYQASDSPADPRLSGPGEIRNALARDLPHAAESSAQSDRISISPQARRLYDASASNPHPAAAIGLAAENIVLYNQIRGERDSLPPGDRRIMELTGKLRAVLMAGGETLSAGDMGYRPPPAVQAPYQDSNEVSDQALPRNIGQSRLADWPGTSASKNRQARPFALHSQDSGDVDGFSFALPYPAPDASREAAPILAHASASASPRIHRAGLDTPEHAHANQASARRLYRLA